MDISIIDFTTDSGAAGLLLAAGSLADLGNRIFTILCVMLGLGLVIFFHELGHFAVAKWCDVHVERFSIGFGPIIWSRQKGETEYALSAVPFGGYVKMLGQDDMDPNQMTDEAIAENPRSYTAKPVWQRMAIISAGVIMNVITGTLFFVCAFGLGVFMPPATIGAVVPASPAWQAGMRNGDRITKINDQDIHNFTDVSMVIALSSGDITLRGVHADGTPFDKTVTPDTSGTRRQIGIDRILGTRFIDEEKAGRSAIMQGMPGERASPPIESHDQIVEIDGEPVESFDRIQQLLARKRDREIDLTLERRDGSRITSHVGATQFRQLGLWMTMGRIESIVADSPASRAGLKVHDQIVRIDGLEAGKEINPVRLPDYFFDRAADENPVTLEVRRQEPGGGEETLTLELKPQDHPGWIEYPFALDLPLPVPAAGIAFHVIPRVAHVVPGSPAAEQGIQVGQKVTNFQLVTPEGKQTDDLKDPAETIIDESEGKDDPEKPVNWAYAFHTMQRTPGRFVKLGVEDQPVVDLHPTSDLDSDWYLPVRGFYLEPAQELQKATGFSNALHMGWTYTRNSAYQIYMTLRSLFRGDLSPKELHGPIGIARVGYAVAKEGVSTLLLFLGFLSINLAVLNFLPIPVLDGGHMVFLAWEGLTRRRPSERVLAAATYLGMIFVLSLMVFVLFLDIFVHLLGFGQG